MPPLPPGTKVDYDKLFQSIGMSTFILYYIDDDEDEIIMLNKHCPNIVAMNHEYNVNWKKELTTLIKSKIS